MKSPWKFLAQLTSRKRPAETRENSVGDDTEASESGARQTSALLSNSTGASSSPDHDENPNVDVVATATSHKTDGDLDLPQALSPPVDREEVQTPAHEVSRSGAEAHVLKPENQKGQKSPRTARAERAKTTRTDLVSESTAVAMGDQSAQSSSSREKFFGDVASLDEEIRQLRRQLAQKLHLQNVQLIKLLERFDGS